MIGTQSGHVKQGLKCKQCRVNIHLTCGAKVHCIDGNISPHSFPGECLPAQEEESFAEQKKVNRDKNRAGGKGLTK